MGCDQVGQDYDTARTVSIHAPRVGCDEAWVITFIRSGCFNSRTPCGVRRLSWRRINFHRLFQFTHPVWGATVERSPCLVHRVVSIHAPRVGCDLHPTLQGTFYIRFNSRTPCGVRPLARTKTQLQRTFQFTHPVWGATVISLMVDPTAKVSIHAPRVGCDNRLSDQIL